MAPQRDRQMEFAWPDPGLRPERGRSAVIGPPRGRPRQRWRLDIGRLLGDVPRADTIMAEQVLEGLAGMFGLGPRAGRARRPGHAAGRYAAWQAAERSGAGGYAISAGAGRHATPAEQVPEANRVVAPRREPVSAPGLHTGPADAEADPASPVSDDTDAEWQKFLRERQAVIDEYAKEKMAEAAAEYAGVALQMACALTDRIPADSKVHQLPLQADIARMLKKADACSDLPQEKVNTIARGIAKDRAAFESKIAFARELVAGAEPIRLDGAPPDRFDEDIFVAQLRTDSGPDADGGHPMRLNTHPVRERYSRDVDRRVTDDLVSGLAVPTKEEHLVARLSLLPDRSEDEASIAAALNEALRWGRPMEGAKLQHERAAVLHRLGSAGDIDKWIARDLLVRLYRSHTFQEIRALADPERDLPATMPPIDDVTRGAAALGYAKSAKVASDVLTKFSWTPHMRQHGLGITESQSMSRGRGMAM